MSKKVLLLVEISDQAFDLMKGGAQNTLYGMLSTNNDLKELRGTPIFQCSVADAPQCEHSAVELMLLAEAQADLKRKRINADPNFYTENPDPCIS